MDEEKLGQHCKHCDEDSRNSMATERIDRGSRAAAAAARAPHVVKQDSGLEIPGKQKNSKLIFVKVRSTTYCSGKDEPHAMKLSPCTNSERNIAMCSRSVGCDVKQNIVEHCGKDFCRS